MTNVSSRQRSILMVEDSPEDRAVMERLLRRSGFTAPIHICESGERALHFLRDVADREGTLGLPALVLLDLNMPGLDGRELLGHLKADERLRPLPVVVLTTSSNPRDVVECYGRGCNSYLVKSVDYQDFQRVVNEIVAYWFDTTLLPAHVQ